MAFTNVGITQDEVQLIDRERAVLSLTNYCVWVGALRGL